jgi:hypothetical protein
MAFCFNILTAAAVGALMCFTVSCVALLVWKLGREDGGDSGRIRLLARKREIIGGYPKVGLTGFRGSVVRLSLPHANGWGR